MSFQFARILEQELQAVGLNPLDIPPCVTEAAQPRAPRPSISGEALPAPIEDRTVFSATAISLSSSLREYAHDAVRPLCGDPHVVTGWSEAGYLRDTGQGLCGEVRFTTAAGTVVTITAGKPGDADIRVRAVKDGVEHSFALDDFSECRNDSEPAFRPAPACALPGRRDDQRIGEIPAETITYSPRTLGKKATVAQSPLFMAC